MSFDAARQLADDIFCSLVSERGGDYVEFTELRSRPFSDFVDARIGDQWYRITAAEIDEPIDACESSGCNDADGCEGHEP